MIIVYILVYLIVGFLLAKFAKYFAIKADSKVYTQEEYAIFVFIWLPIFIWLLMVKIFNLFKEYI